MYKVLANIIDADLIEFMDLTEELCLILDEEGLLKSGNLVYEITFNGEVHHVAGKFAIGRNEWPEDGIKTVPLLMIDDEVLRELLWIVIGTVR